MSGAVPLLLFMPLRCAQENLQLTFNLKKYKQRKFGSYARIINYTIFSSAQPHAARYTSKNMIIYACINLGMETYAHMQTVYFRRKGVFIHLKHVSTLMQK